MSIRIDVTVRFDTVFIIESLTPELDDRVEYDNGSVSLSFSDVSELMAGVSGRCDNSVVVDDAECYAVTVSYAAGYTAANGFVTFYSPIE